ncbi:ribonuclease P/MRP protein subunit POP5 [Hypomesus transpacificus]|uniref:ribonuclease P/MRP protein subunit POP5 n=1 Tax=Hypomesus transpacificus TaxID=137520 RepID=UPI001F07FD40|nr:ribonuclease P/MRP protein subunit POP5 [Hypomesus transpacificus]
MVRFKSRYLLCEVNVTDRNSLSLLDDRSINAMVKGAVSRMHGDYGAALCNIGFTVKYVNAHTGIVFLRCRKSHYRTIWSALPFISILENRGHKVPCFLNCLHVGGTIRTCQKFLVRYNTQQLHRMLPNCQSEAERLEVERAVLSCSIVKGQENEYELDSEEEEEEIPEPPFHAVDH